MEQPANDTTGKEIVSTQTDNHPIETELVAQVQALETDAQKIDDSEVQAKIQQLIKLIRTTLKSQNLSHKTQKELARLLSLLSNLDNRHIQQLNLLDLAVSILLEPDDSKPTDRSAQGLLNRTSNEAKNLIFVQETRRQVAHQSRAYPDVIRAFVTGSGTPYIRLITGLTWFFVLFVLAPTTISGLIFAATKLPNNQDLKRSTRLNTALIADVESKDAQITSLTSRNNALLVNLERTSRLLSSASEEEISTPNPPAPSNTTPPPATDSPPTGSPTTSPVTAPAPQTSSDQPNPQGTIPVRIDTLNSIQSEIAKGLAEEAQQAVQSAASNPKSKTADSPAGGTGNSPDNQKTADSTVAGKPSLTESNSEGAIEVKDDKGTFTFNVLPTRTGPWPIALAISIGALGGTVSVIVRANTFIRQAQESENDLFLTGFFRPFVGMSFAIFCIALVEAGVFSGIFDLSKREDEADRTYFYIAIAFVAGFSERLVRDVVIKTEDTLAGPKTITPTDP